MVTNPAGGGLNLLNPAIGVLNNLYGEVNVLGAIIDAPTEISINGVRTLTKQELKHLDYDMILAAGDHASLVPIIQQADELGIDIDKTVLDRTVCVPLFTMEKYNHLRNSALSIISVNCWGGLLYHRLGLPFLTPTINMFLKQEQFAEFLSDPIKNMNKKPQFYKMETEIHAHTQYPILKVGKFELHMNHFAKPEPAVKKWNERKAKVNWFNSLIMTYTDDANLLAEFDKLPFGKKVAFVPFDSNLNSAYNVHPENYPGKPLYQIVNESAIGSVVNYDIWDMLLYGKRTPLQAVNR